MFFRTFRLSVILLSGISFRTFGLLVMRPRADYLGAMSDRTTQRREAQARFRKVHAERIGLARTAMNILIRQKWHATDAKVLAAAIVKLLGKDCTKELRKELVKRAGVSRAR